MFSTNHVTQVLAARNRAQALDVWRDAANLVSTRWQLFVEADADGRQWAFASYVAALDAEEAAAAEMAALTQPMAARGDPFAPARVGRSSAAVDPGACRGRLGQRLGHLSCTHAVRQRPCELVARGDVELA